MMAMFLSLDEFWAASEPKLIGVWCKPGWATL
jgi:hypothetical protein